MCINACEDNENTTIGSTETGSGKYIFLLNKGMT